MAIDLDLAALRDDADLADAVAFLRGQREIQRRLRVVGELDLARALRDRERSVRSPP